MMRNLLSICCALMLLSSGLYAQCDAVASVPVIPVNPFCQDSNTNAEMVITEFTSMSMGTTNEEYVILQSIEGISDPNDWAIVGVTEWSYDGISDNAGFDFEAAAPGTYHIMPFAFNQEDLDGITQNPLAGGVIGASGQESLNEILVLFPNITVVEIPDPLTINAVLGVITNPTVVSLVGFEACVAVGTADDLQSLEIMETCEDTGGCDAVASVPVIPLNPFCQNVNTNDQMIITEFVSPPTGAANEEYVILQEVAGVASPYDWEIVGVTEWTYDGINAGGGFDFETATPGTYHVLPFAFSQADLDGITQNPLAGGVIGASGLESLNEILELFPNITVVEIPDPLTVNAVLGVITNATVVSLIGFEPCVAVGAEGDLQILEIVAECGPGFDCEELMANIGDACDDGNANTENDVISADCVCAGTPVDPVFDCPDLMANIGDPCNDGDPNTNGDQVQANCSCAGTAIEPGGCISLTMPSALQVYCAEAVACAQPVVEGANPGDLVVYAVHTSPTSVPGDILGTSADCNFYFVDLAGAAYNTQYYLSALGGPDADGDGIPDFDHPCFTVAPGTPIVYLAPIVIDDSNAECSDDENETTVFYTISGGYPEFDSSQTYTVSGDVNTTLSFGEVVTAVYGDGSLYSVSASDGFGCSGAVSGGPLECVKTPIELIDFSGQAADEGNFLTWTTGSEVNSKFFTLERSRDGQTFESIVNIEAAGNSETAITYEFMDVNFICADEFYYRLNQTDFDGQVNLIDETVRIERESCGLEIGAISPQPASDQFTVEFSTAADQEVQFGLYDMTGKQVSMLDVNAEAGFNQTTFDVSALPKGMYFLNVNTNNISQTMKVIVE